MVDQFYVIRVKWLKDGTIKKSELMSYQTREQAISKYHANMAADMVDETLSGSMCSVLNQIGNLVLSDYWGRITVVEETPSEEG